ncbi:MAG TPA: hypothetical protein PKX46_04360 [Clostridia bacterium]|nr:MAG: hypothetical protein BWY62_00588 [Firmicutes bacterium ADurb.Bin356]HOF93933.1 hypothetical protein [Clostridia bacterium]HOR13136.1 hypothetical protein [Clostridia bacterium]
MKRPDLRSMKQNPELMRQASEAANPETMAVLQNTFMQYQGKSETELIDELMRKASIQRQKGMLNNAQLETLSNMLGPMLTREQQQRMYALIDELKKE